MDLQKDFWLGLSMCRDADYYAFADQDDVWKPNKLIRCINVMQEVDKSSTAGILQNATE